MYTIGELLGAHANEEAWIFGKGPSLDSFDFKNAGSLRICINESALVVPGARYFFAHDELPIRRCAVAWPTGCRAILQPVRADLAVTHGIPEDCVFTYTKCERELQVLDWLAAKIAEKNALLGLTGTVHSAIHFCRLIGASSIVFVGMDGRGGYATRVGLPVPAGGGQHDVIRRDSITIAKRLGFGFRFVGSTN